VNALTRKRGPLPTWAWIAIAVGAFLGYRYWRSRQSSTDQGGGASGPSSGLQPIAGGGIGVGFGTPMGGALSASTVSTPTANGVGSSTVGTTALHTNVIGTGGVGSNAHPAEGDPTGSPGAPNIANVSSQSQLNVSGGWGVTWTGPGTYEARKFTGVGGSDTRWVKVG
jgi:hypothetical protein